MATTYTSQYVLTFKDLASKGFLSVSNAADKMTSHLANIGKGVAAVGTGLGAATTLVNQSTAQQEALAASVGSSTSELLGLSAVARTIGLDFDNVIDQEEEVINKFKEIAAAGELPVTAIEGLKGLGFTEAEFANIAKYGDLTSLINKGLQSVADGTRTVKDVQSALDQIAGGEANKIFGALAKQGVTSVEELNRRYERLNFLTEEGKKGAVDYTKSFNDLTFSLGTLSREGFGQLGSAIAPVIDNLTEFLATNKELIQTNLTNFMTNLSEAVKDLNFSDIASSAQQWFTGISNGINTISSFIESLGGAATILKGFLGLFVVGKVASFTTAIAGLVAVIGGPVTLAIAGATAAGVLLYQNWDTVKEKLVSFKDTLLGSWESIKTGTEYAFNRMGEVVESIVENIKSKIADVANFFIDKINFMISQYNKLAGTGFGEFLNLGTVDVLQKIGQEVERIAVEDAAFAGALSPEQAVLPVPANIQKSLDDFVGNIPEASEQARMTVDVQQAKQAPVKVEVELKGEVKGADVEANVVTTGTSDSRGSTKPYQSRRW